MLAWDHNAYYHATLLKEIPEHPARVLDVGCGVGHLAVRLAQRSQHVDAVDVDDRMVAATEALVPANVSCWNADIMTDDLPSDHYDAIVSLSVLHHLDLLKALPRLAAALRPGGVLAGVALPKVDLPRELAVECGAIIVHHVLGVGLAVSRHPWRVGLPHPAHPGSVPMKDPTLTVRDVRQQARAVLPSASVRRLLLWRYLLTWRKATDHQIDDPDR